MTVDLEQLSCQELVELVTDYFEGALSGTERARFEAHIGRCNPCTIYLEQMRLTIELVGHLPAEALSQDAEQALLEAFQGWRAS